MFLILYKLYYSDCLDECFTRFKIISWNLFNYLKVSPGEGTQYTERAIGRNSEGKSYGPTADFSDASNQIEVT